MRRIPIPENIQLVDPLTERPGEWVPWKRWYLASVLNDTRMGTSPVDLARIVAIVAKVKDLAPGRVLELEDEDWDKGRIIVETPNPQLGLGGPLVMMQFAPFSSAYLKAQYVNDAKTKTEKK